MPSEESSQQHQHLTANTVGHLLRTIKALTAIAASSAQHQYLIDWIRVGETFTHSCTPAFAIRSARKDAPVKRIAPSEAKLGDAGV